MHQVVPTARGRVPPPPGSTPGGSSHLSFCWVAVITPPRLPRKGLPLTTLPTLRGGPAASRECWGPHRDAGLQRGLLYLPALQRHPGLSSAGVGVCPQDGTGRGPCSGALSASGGKPTYSRDFPVTSVSVHSFLGFHPEQLTAAHPGWGGVGGENICRETSSQDCVLRLWL